MKVSESSLKSVLEIADEISSLVKSMNKLKKDEEEPKEEQQEAEASPDAAAEGAADAPEAEASQEAPAEGEGQEAEASQEAPAEGEGQEQEMSLEQHIAAMSDDELHSMLESLMQELEKRHGAAEAQGQDPAQAQPAAQPEMDKSDEYSKMQKSIQDLASSVAKIAERLDSAENLSKSQKPAGEPKKPVATQSAPAMGSAEVLTKSATKPQRLTKSETAEFLIGRQRNGDRIISSDDLLNLNSVKSEEQLHKFQDSLAKRGVEFPKF
jgi:hypothetical protein